MQHRGLYEALTAEFTPDRPELVEALTDSDTATGPDGRHVTDRLAGIRSATRPGTWSRSISAATPCITIAVRTVETALVADREPSAG